MVFDAEPGLILAQTAHEILSHRVIEILVDQERFPLPCVREEAPTAEQDLRTMAQNGSPFGFDFIGIQDQLKSPSVAGQRVAMDDVGKQTRRCLVASNQLSQRDIYGYADRAVVRVAITQGGCREMGRAPSADCLTQFFVENRSRRQQHVRQPLVRPRPKLRAVGAVPEDAKRSQCLLTTQHAPTRARRFSRHAPASFERALGPRVIVTVGQENDARRCSRPRRPLQQPAGGQDLIIGMGRQNQESVGPGESG